jgi:hypothetical protein
VTPKTATKTDSRLAARIAAIASLGAAVIHFAVVPTHWREWVPSGIFFASIAVCQLIWAFCVMVRPGAAVLAVGILANLGSVALWVLSRTAGAPFGPQAGEPEVVQAAGIFALMLECYVVMGAAWLWYRGRRADPVSGVGYGTVLIGAATVIGAATTLGVVSGLQHDHHSTVGAEHDHHAPVGEEEVVRHEHAAPVAPSDSEIVPELTAPTPVEFPPPTPEGSDDFGHDHEE